MGAPLQQAIEYHSTGLSCLPLPLGEKKLMIPWRDWQTEPQEERDVIALFKSRDDCNIAILCGAASHNLLVIDADTAQSFRETRERLAADGIETWVVQSGSRGNHAGGGHFYVFASEPVQTIILPGIGEVRGQGAYVIAPYSLHPRGTRYEFVAKPPVIFTLPELNALPWLPLEPARNNGVPKLPRLAWRLLQNDSQAVSKYSTRSEAEAALVASLIRAQRSFNEIAQLLISYPGPGKFQEMHRKNSRNALRYLRLTYENALNFVASNANEVAQIAGLLKHWALSSDWSGRTGATDRAVFLAHIAIVEMCGREPHGASARQLAEMAGVTWKTAARANHRLIEQGLLSLEVPAVASLSARYRLPMPESAQSVHTTSQIRVIECVSTVHQDVFRWHGLGKTGFDVFTCLLKHGDDGARVSTVARETGRHRSTVRAKFKVMFALGLVEPLGSGLWQALDSADLDRAALELGTAGRGDAERRRHALDRRRHRTVLALGRRS